MDDDIRKISNRIKEMRKARNITQKQLAEALDISVTNMCNIEKGKTAVTMQNLIKMKWVFKCELQDFFTIEAPIVAKDTKANGVAQQAVDKAESAQVEVKADAKSEEKLPESIDLQDAINLLRLLRRIDIKGL